MGHLESSFAVPGWTSSIRSMPPGSQRGLFIVLEGCDRSGKSTQAEALVQGLLAQNVSAELMAFPNRTTVIGRILDTYLKSAPPTPTDAKESHHHLSNEVIHLLFSANRWECAHHIVSTLLAGTNIICDRYSHSGIAYSTAKGLDQGWCESCDVGLPAPDLILYMDATPETMEARPGFGGERYEKREFQQRVRACYESMKANHFARGQTPSSLPLRWIGVNANESAEEITKNLLLTLRLELLREHQSVLPILFSSHSIPVPTHK